MLCPIKVIEVDLSQPVQTVPDLFGYRAVHALIRWGEVPVGWVEVPIENGHCQATTIVNRATEWFGEKILKTQLVQQLNDASPTEPTVYPLVTVAVCTRDRPDDLAICLAGLVKLTASPLEILVIDNAPSDDRSQTLVTQLMAQHPHIRYVREPRPGLDWARK
jgi:O-antigen biosynthesis protein